MLAVKQISLVRNDFRRLAPARPEMFKWFYDRLFEIAPHTRDLYSESLTEESSRVNGLLEIAFLSLDHPQAMFATLHTLGRDFSGFGIWETKLHLVVDLLVEVFAEFGGEDWGSELEKAWHSVLIFIAQGMKEGVVAKGAIA
ncbi:Hemoglobin-like flavoprotein [Celeribacter baekdonensis]|uniref:Hemoglobin-like flavoprotein n=1 Tax=Celeribacter baekdonensis TaxID=875171 RepID=A0A1G7K468_9RHOB|nr:globin domain-containing protein [Celeribacter baekdonensis]SDF31890.1 Hemoglobin-like flavoprotein [Celeribacter baekdonensis]